MSFGRKGLPASEPMTPIGGRESAEALSPQLAAFLASERQRAPDLPPPDEMAALPKPTGVRNDDPHPLNSQLIYPRDPMARGQYSLVLAYALWCFFGVLGAHRTYLGARMSGNVMAVFGVGGLLLVFFGHFEVGMAVLALFMVWAIIDLFLLPGLARRANNPEPAAA